MKVTPDIYGLWALHGTTLAPDGSTFYEWDADMEIVRRDGPPAVISGVWSGGWPCGDSGRDADLA